ncbi:MAG: hypothetical protein CMJ24_01880 [Phycisphaerae bacterium]|nr:hypothetical protein [Phycisphaerae bacterium]|tara:strand:- start:39622 stop:41400 length:1779 start_codon:yes stop_codon:yes gene_type:complete
MTRTPNLIVTLIILLAGTLSAEATTDSSLPDVEDSVAAWYVSREWVDAFSIPEPDAEASEAPIDNATGCCLIIRQEGRIIGIGDAMKSEGSMLHRAARRALSMAQADPALRAIPDELLAEVGTRLTIELEVSGPMQPLIGRSPKEFRDDIHPLRHGIALRWNDQWAVKYPSRLRVTNRWADTSLLDGMAISIGLDSGLRDSLQRKDVGAYRFRTIDLAQAAPDAPPQLVVGGTMTQPTPMPGIRDLVSTRDSILDHIRQRQWPGEENRGLVGSYEPASDRYDPIVATAMDQGLTAWALGRVAQSPGASRAAREAASDAAAQILSSLLAREDDASYDPLDDAAILLALESNEVLSSPETERIRRERRTRLAEETERWVEDDGNARRGHDLALASMAIAFGGNDEDRALARRLADAAWDRTTVEQQVSLLPWIAWTEMRLAESTGDHARLKSIDELRHLVLQRQVPPGEERFGSELAGGIVLGKMPADVTAKSLRPIAAMASMYSDDRITTAQERDEQFSRLLLAMRFIMQLQVESGDTSIYRNASRTNGGIRMALWDSRMPTIAQAMALVALSDAIELLHVDSSDLPPGEGLY